jgi:hypothetical protein
MSSTWRRYAKGLVREDLAAPDNGVNVNIRVSLMNVLPVEVLPVESLQLSAYARRP